MSYTEGDEWTIKEWGLEDEQSKLSSNYLAIRGRTYKIFGYFIENLKGWVRI